MPANKKYLSRSPGMKFGKLMAAIFGSLMASVGLHMALAMWLDRGAVVSTAVYSGFLIWALFMVVAYWIPRVLHVWLLFLGITLISVVAIWLGS